MFPEDMRVRLSVECLFSPRLKQSEETLGPTGVRKGSLTMSLASFPQNIGAYKLPTMASSDGCPVLGRGGPLSVWSRSRSMIRDRENKVPDGSGPTGIS